MSGGGDGGGVRTDNGGFGVAATAVVAGTVALCAAGGAYFLWRRRNGANASGEPQPAAAGDAKGTVAAAMPSLMGLSASRYRTMEVKDAPEACERLRSEFKREFLGPCVEHDKPLERSTLGPRPWTVTGHKTLVACEGRQLLGIAAHTFDRSSYKALAPAPHPATACDMLRTVAGSASDEFFFAARDMEENAGWVVNGSVIYHATIVRGAAVRDRNTGKLRWQSVGPLDDWSTPSTVMMCTVALSSAADVTNSTRVHRAPWYADVPWTSGQLRDHRLEFHVRSFDVSLLWIVMASEFGDVLLKHRESGVTSLIVGNGDPVFSVRLVESRHLVVGSSHGHIAVFALLADGTAKLCGNARMADCAVLHTSIVAPMRVWMATADSSLRGVELTDLSHKTFLLPSAALPTVDVQQILTRANFVSPNGHAISYVAAHPTLENVFAICSFAGWCCVLGLEPMVQTFTCSNYDEPLGSAVKVCRWNPCVSTLLAFAESSHMDSNPAIIHVVDTATGLHQTLTLSDAGAVSGLDWCASGRVLFASTISSIYELRLCGANLTLRQYASLGE